MSEGVSFEGFAVCSGGLLGVLPGPYVAISLWFFELAVNSQVQL